jgi:hypothetical protein
VAPNHVQHSERPPEDVKGRPRGRETVIGPSRHLKSDATSDRAEHLVSMADSCCRTRNYADFVSRPPALGE